MIVTAAKKVDSLFTGTGFDEEYILESSTKLISSYFGSWFKKQYMKNPDVTGVFHHERYELIKCKYYLLTFRVEYKSSFGGEGYPLNVFYLYDYENDKLSSPHLAAFSFIEERPDNGGIPIEVFTFLETHIISSGDDKVEVLHVVQSNMNDEFKPKVDSIKITGLEGQ